MTTEQLKIFETEYKKKATRPNGTTSTLGEYTKYNLDGDIDIVSSKDFIFIDNDNELIHAIFKNDNMVEQATYPVKIISADFSMIQKIESVFSAENFQKLINDGYFSTIINAKQKEFMLKFFEAIPSAAQQPMEAEPYFNKDPKIIPAVHTRIERNEYTPILFKSTDANGESKTYASIKEAFADLENGTTLTLNDDIVIADEDVIEITNGAEAKLNLNGKKITYSGMNTLFKVTNGSLTIDNGTIESNGEALRVLTAEDETASIVVNSDVTIVSKQDCVAYVRGKGSSFTSAGILIASGKYATVLGNGLDAGTTINIIGGKVWSDNSIAIYNPQNGILNIENANIQGLVGVYTKAGIINISGDTRVYAFGNADAYEFNNDGANTTGDAFVADFCKYPGGYPVVNISGGEFVSKNANAFACYTRDGATNPEQAPENVTISGGRFSTEISTDYLADGAEITYNATTKRYVIK